MVTVRTWLAPRWYIDVTMTKRRAPAILLLVFSALWLLVCVSVDHAHDTDHSASAAAQLYLPDHEQSCHHGEHSDPHASVAAVVVRPGSGPDAWPDAAVTPPAFQDRGVTQVADQTALGVAPCRPGRALLIDLCVART